MRSREKVPTTLLVQQEIFLSHEVALKRSSLLRSFCDEQEGAVSGQRIMALMIHSEGDETSLEILSVYQCLLTLTYGEKSGNTHIDLAHFCGGVGCGVNTSLVQT